MWDSIKGANISVENSVTQTGTIKSLSPNNSTVQSNNTVPDNGTFSRGNQTIDAVGMAQNNTSSKNLF